MTRDLTPEEEFNPLLLPPVTMEYPRPMASAAVPYIVGSPDLNKWYGGTDQYGMESQGYAGPVTPVMQDQRPAFENKLRYGRGKFPSAYEADYPQSFFPETVDSYEAMFNRQPAGSSQERLWSGSDVRVDFEFAPRRQPNRYGLSGVGDAVWYETPVGSLGLAAVVGTVSYLATRAFLRSRARR